ncbi:hypothetical protein BB558_004795 [Smittium angustum]|uniref:Protein kinase domain-containing protein n=1 Tax=Smittium angustum TaxID=133377 RepID=A0A2U1J2A1_SMIAN|nr:hypothetical protein BB558_004795 [Smittium angustum]
MTSNNFNLSNISEFNQLALLTAGLKLLYDDIKNIKIETEKYTLTNQSVLKTNSKDIKAKTLRSAFKRIHEVQTTDSLPGFNSNKTPKGERIPYESKLAKTNKSKKSKFKKGIRNKEIDTRKRSNPGSDPSSDDSVRSVVYSVSKKIGNSISQTSQGFKQTSKTPKSYSFDERLLNKTKKNEPLIDQNANKGFKNQQSIPQSFKSNSTFSNILGFRYKIIKHAGSGEFSDVYFASDLYIKPCDITTESEYKLVALKKMKKGDNIIGISEYLSFRKLCRKESYALRKSILLYNDIFRYSESSSILKNYENEQYRFDTNDIDNTIVLVTEPLLGGLLTTSLFTRFEKMEHSFSDHNVFIWNKMKLVSKIFRQILVAINVLHNNEIIHSDVKPSNVMFISEESSGVKLIDLGNATSFENIHFYFGSFEIQSIWYRAPEVAMHIKFGPEIDVWSAGCVLCELWTLKPLFTPKNNDDLIGFIKDLRGPFPKHMKSQNNIPSDEAIHTSNTNESVLNELPTPTSDNGGMYYRNDSNIYNYEWNALTRIQVLCKELDSDCSEFLSLVDMLLQIDPKKRISAKEALNHPFFEKYL